MPRQNTWVTPEQSIITVNDFYFQPIYAIDDFVFVYQPGMTVSVYDRINKETVTIPQDILIKVYDRHADFLQSVILSPACTLQRFFNDDDVRLTLLQLLADSALIFYPCDECIYENIWL